MRIAVLSDIHGALPALEAVLAEPDVRNADRVVLTGDLAAGPMPVETLDALVALGDRALWISGNADRELVELRRDPGLPNPDPIAPWAARALRDDQVALLAGLPSYAELGLSGFGRTVFCHATPRDDDEVVLVDSRPARWSEVFAGLSPEVGLVVCGHTHMPYARLVDRRWVVNPGSVGMPYGGVGAHWALLAAGAVTLRVTAYDIPAAIERVATASGYPGARGWAEEYLTSRHSDADALDAFGPRDGRPA